MSDERRLMTGRRGPRRAHPFAWTACLPIVLLPAAAAFAEAPCAPRASLLSELADKYSEAPSAHGLSSDGTLVEVLTSDDGETWTIIISMPNGTSCLVASGESWTAAQRLAQGETGI